MQFVTGIPDGDVEKGAHCGKTPEAISSFPVFGECNHSLYLPLLPGRVSGFLQSKEDGNNIHHRETGKPLLLHPQCAAVVPFRDMSGWMTSNLQLPLIPQTIIKISCGNGNCKKLLYTYVNTREKSPLQTYIAAGFHFCKILLPTRFSLPLSSSPASFPHFLSLALRSMRMPLPLQESLLLFYASLCRRLA